MSIRHNNTIIAGTYTSQINNKANKDFSNVDANIDYIVEYQMPTSTNNYTWYRKYNSGWVEQGCGNVVTPATVTLPVTMQDTEYSINATPLGNGNHVSIQAEKASTTQITISNEEDWNMSWEVKGQAQQ